MKKVPASCHFCLIKTHMSFFPIFSRFSLLFLRFYFVIIMFVYLMRNLMFVQCINNGIPYISALSREYKLPIKMDIVPRRKSNP